MTAVDWPAVAAGLVGYQARRLFPFGVQRFPRGFMRVAGSEVGFLLSGVRLDRPPPPQRTIYCGGRPLIEVGRPPPPEVSFDQLVAPAALLEALLDRCRPGPGPTLEIDVSAGDDQPPIMSVTVEAPMVWQMGTLANAQGMACVDWMTMAAAEIWIN